MNKGRQSDERKKLINKVMHHYRTEYWNRDQIKGGVCTVAGKLHL